MLVWIENAQKYEINPKDEVFQYVDTFLTCDSEDPEIAELAELQSHKHSRTCRKKVKALCRFGFPLPPLPRTMLLYPLDEDVEKYRKKYVQMQKAMNDYKEGSDLSFKDFLNRVMQMNEEDYVKCIRSSLNSPNFI